MLVDVLVLVMNVQTYGRAVHQLNSISIIDLQLGVCKLSGCLLLLHLLLISVKNIRVFFLILRHHECFLQALLRGVVVIKVPANFIGSSGH